jgi:hypothetical protein
LIYGSAGKRSIIVEEKSDVWINLHELLHCFEPSWAPPGVSLQAGDFCFLWGSERSGFMQLYLYQFEAATGRAVNLSGDVPIGGGGEFVVER